jgi:hypothetical protein
LYHIVKSGFRVDANNSFETLFAAQVAAITLGSDVTIFFALI